MAGPPSPQPREGGGRAPHRPAGPDARSCAPRMRGHGSRRRRSVGNALGLPQQAGPRRIEERSDRLESTLDGHQTTAPVWTVVIRRRSASNASSATRGMRLDQVRSTSGLPARASSAASVGSPLMVHGSWLVAGAWSDASLQAAATRASRSREASFTGGDRTVRSARNRRRSRDSRRSGSRPVGEHPVLGQGAGLVAADHGDRPEGLDGRQLANECVSLGHPRAPRARAIVTTAGRPSGMAATARLTAVRNMTSTGSPRAIPLTKTKMRPGSRNRQSLAEHRSRR